MPDQTPGSLAFRKSDWWSAAGLFMLVVLMSTVRPSVLVAIPFLLLVVTSTLRSYVALGATVIAMMMVFVGPYDGVWYLEHGWALLLGGCFLGLSLAQPQVRLSDRALNAIFVSILLMAIFLALRSGAWSALEWSVSDGIRIAVAQVITLAGADGLAPAVVAVLYKTAEVQILIFPALTALGSFGALVLSWWLFLFVSGEGKETLGSISNFRFNDHLIWILVVGLLLLLSRWSEPLHRLGTNAVVFIGALFAVRGVAVVVFMTGGLSIFGYAIAISGLVIVPPIVIGSAVLIGIADIYIDFRKRANKLAAG